MATPLVAAPAFEAGDRVVFIGDSITHGGSYHTDAYLFYATRFPTQKFVCYNAGISGDTSVGTNKRFLTDVAVHRPTIATVMLGMNDAWAWPFDLTLDVPDVARVDGRENAYATYCEAMKDLAVRLDSANCETIFLTPSIYDQTADLPEKNLLGKNDLLRKFSDYVKRLAEEHGGSVVDFYSLINEINARLQEEDPTATIVGADRVHPNGPGHLVMTYALLKAQGMPALVSAIEIDAAAGRVTRQSNCELQIDSTLTPDGVAFDCIEHALPFPVTDDKRQTLDLVPFQRNLNQQRLTVAGLAAGNYTLRIDDAEVGTYTDDELAAGVNLAGNQRTPQYAQALQVKTANDERLAIVSKLRALMHVRHTMLRGIEPAPLESDLRSLEIALRAHVEESRDQPWYGYLSTQVDNFLEALPQEEELRAEEEARMATMWEINKPVSHRWIIEPIGPR